MSPYSTVLFLSLCSICTGLATPTSAASEPELDAEIAFVSTGGAWSNGDRTGFVRVVVVNGGFEHATSSLFLQWLAVDREREAWIVESLPVTSINHPGVWSLGQPKISHENEVTVVRLHATNPYDGEDTVFMVSVRGPGDFGVEHADARP